MKKKLLAILLCMAMVGMYSMGSTISVFADDSQTGGTPAAEPAPQTTEAAPDDAVTTLSLNVGTLALTIGTPGTLTATAPAGSTVAWTSSSDAIATVSGGTVTPVAEGTATITATATVGEATQTATCQVTVSKAAPAQDPGEAEELPTNCAVLNDNIKVTYDTIVAAINAAKDGDTIKVYGTVLWGGEGTASDKNVTITTGKGVSDDDAQAHVVLNGANKYNFPTNHGNDDTPNITNFNCGTTLDNINVERSDGINFLFANGYKLVINSNVVCNSNGSECSGETSGSNLIAVGGSYRSEVASADMTLNGGSYEYVIGGGLGQKVTGNISLTTGTFAYGILGGSYRSDVGGSTAITVNGEVGVLGGVCGGCYEGSVGGNTSVTINNTIGNSGYSAVFGGSLYKGSVAGNTNVVIGAKGNVGSGVYGGNSGMVNDPNPLGAGNNQRYSQKANEQVIYPAARTIEKSFIGGDTHVTVEAGGICNDAVYGGGADTPVNGSTFVTVNGTVYGDANAEGVYGGGAYVGADIGKDTNVVIGETASIPMREVNYDFMGGDTRIGGAVFGGGRFSAVNGNTNVTLNGKVGSEGLGGLVFGGGYGAMRTGTATVLGTSTINVNVAPYTYTIDKSLGWQQYTFNHFGLENGQTGIFGGGMNSDCDATSVININADLNGNPVYGDGLYEWITGKSTINVNKGGVIYKVWGWYDDEKTDGYYKRAEGDYANVIFNDNTSSAEQINNATLVKVTNNSAVTIDNNNADNQQLVDVQNLAIDNNGKLTLLATAGISGSYTGDGTGTLVVPAMNSDISKDDSIGRLNIGGTVTGVTKISIVDTDAVKAKVGQVYVKSAGSRDDAAAKYNWIDKRSGMAMAWKSVGDFSKWYLEKYDEPINPPYYPPVNPPVNPPVVDPGDNNNTPEPTDPTTPTKPDTPVVDPGENNNTNEPVVDKPDNSNADQPKTGDENNAVPWAITLFAGSMLAGVVIKRRKDA